MTIATHRPRRLPRLAAVPLALTLVLAGCGDDDDVADEATDAVDVADDDTTTSEDDDTTTSEDEDTTTTEDDDATTTSAGGDQAAAMLVTEDIAFVDVPDVRPGATIRVVNRDAVPHTVTADEGGLFDTRVEPNGEATFTAPSEPGSYPFHCEIHPTMQAVLEVRPS